MLGVVNQFVNVSVDEKMRSFNFFFLPFAADVNAKQLVMLLENLPEAGVVEGLIVLEENQRKIKFTEREFEFLFDQRKIINFYL